MTNDETLNPRSTRVGLPRRQGVAFGFRHSFIIRHSAFVICALALAFSSCNSKTITKANVDEVTDGMSKKQVESILGPPTTIDTKDFVLLKKTTYVYAQGKESVTIVFKDDKVQSKASTLSE